MPEIPEDGLMHEGRIMPRAPAFLRPWLRRLLDWFEKPVEKPAAPAEADAKSEPSTRRVLEISEPVPDDGDVHLLEFPTQSRDPSFGKGPQHP